MMAYYKRIDHAIEYYVQNGYTWTEVPWTVDKDVLYIYSVFYDIDRDITTPPNKREFRVLDKLLVASAEQSFLQLVKSGTITLGKKYVSCTPCFRDEEVLDKLHQTYFTKVELFEWAYHERDPQKKKIMADMDVWMKKLAEMVSTCQTLFRSYGVETSVVATGPESTDIVDDSGVELGSYGIRIHEVANKTIVWLYGTGLAEPRFSYVLKTNMGYHNTCIPKGKLGTLEKIREELDEAKDAETQSNKIMTVVELSDMYGAIESYLETNFSLFNMNDLKIMSDATKRAFTSGRRTQ